MRRKSPNWQRKGFKTFLCLLLAMVLAAGSLMIVSAQEDTTQEASKNELPKEEGGESQKQYTVAVVDGESKEAIPGAKVELSGVEAEGNPKNNQITFTLPEGSSWQAEVTADGYQTGHGRLHRDGDKDVEETIALYPAERDTPMDETVEPQAQAVEERPEADVKEDVKEAAAPPAEDPEGPAQEEGGQAAEEEKESLETGEEAGTNEAPEAEDNSKTQDDSKTQEDSKTQDDTKTQEPQKEGAAPEDQPDTEGSEDNTPKEDGEVTDAPPAWADSAPGLKGNLSLAEELKLLEGELDKQVRVVQDSLDIPEEIQISYEADNLPDIWAVYALLNNMTEDYPYGAKITDQEARRKLRSIFWDMTNVTGSVKRIDGEPVYIIQVTRKGWQEMSEIYGIQDRGGELSALLTPESRRLMNGQLSGSILDKLSDEEFKEIQRSLEGMEGERRSVVLAALSLEGKVKYFWGGKSQVTGWDGLWGNMYTVTSEGSSQTGTRREFGLDCSGYVSWAFINAGGGPKILSYIGNGTASQWQNSREITMAEAKPGDLLFLKRPGDGGTNHVGIVIQNDGGKLTVAHCSGSRNGVVVTDASGFHYARRPYLYQE